MNEGDHEWLDLFERRLRKEPASEERQQKAQENRHEQLVYLFEGVMFRLEDMEQRVDTIIKRLGHVQEQAREPARRIRDIYYLVFSLIGTVFVFSVCYLLTKAFGERAWWLPGLASVGCFGLWVWWFIIRDPPQRA
jgi:hypothetical protein